MHKLIILIIPLLFLGAFCAGPEYEPIENGRAPAAAGADLAFVRGGRLWAAKSASGEEFELADGNGNRSAPAFFPSRSEVMYLRSDPPYSQFIKYGLGTGEEEFVFATKGEPDYYGFSPNGRFALFCEGGGLFLLDMESRKAEQVADGVLDAAWSPDSRSFAYAGEEGGLYLREFDVREKLDEEERLADGPVRVPRFIGADKLVFEECGKKKCSLAEYDLYRREKSRVLASFDADGPGGPALAVSPEADFLAYQRVDPRLESPVITVLSYPGGGEEARYEYASRPFWLREGRGLMFVREELDENGKFRENMYLAEIGREPVLFIPDAASPVSSAAYRTNL